MLIKKVFFIFLFLSLVVIIMLVAYNLAFKHNVTNPKAGAPASNTEAPAANNQDTGSATASGKLENVLNEEVLGVAMGNNGDLFYYSISDQEIKRASFEGKDKSTLLSNLPGTPERLLWSPKRDQVIIALRNGNQLRFHHLNIATKALTPLKPEISHVTWSEQGDKIYYEYTDPTSGNRSLDVANPDGSNHQTLASLGTIDHYIEPVPASNLVSFWTRPTGLQTTILESVTAAGSDRKVLLQDRYGADYLWSPTGQEALVSLLDQKGTSHISLSLINKNGGELQNLGIPTLVSKAAWSQDGKTLYYALPGGIPDSSVLPNDYYSRPLYSQDTFWKLDKETGRKTRLLELAETSQSYDSDNLFLSPKEDYLFFVDRQDHKLYRIEL